jgi:hypothetical protein
MDLPLLQHRPGTQGDEASWARCWKPVQAVSNPLPTADVLRVGGVVVRVDVTSFFFKDLTQQLLVTRAGIGLSFTETQHGKVIVVPQLRFKLMMNRV